MEKTMADPQKDRLIFPTGLTRSFAQSPEEVREAQRLRYQVFSREMGARMDSCVAGIDSDAFDPLCHHLIVREKAFGQVVETTRILPPQTTQRAIVG